MDEALVGALLAAAFLAGMLWGAVFPRVIDTLGRGFLRLSRRGIRVSDSWGAQHFGSGIGGEHAVYVCGRCKVTACATCLPIARCPGCGVRVKLPKDQTDAS